MMGRKNKVQLKEVTYDTSLSEEEKVEKIERIKYLVHEMLIHCIKKGTRKAIKS